MRFFCSGWLCCIYELIWYFGGLGFDDFAGVRENGGFEIYDSFFELNFLGFLCVCFLRNFLDLLVCLLGKNMKFMFWERRNFPMEKKIIIRLMLIFYFLFLFSNLAFFFLKIFY